MKDNLRVENLKLKEKSETVTSVTHASRRSYKLKQTRMVKYLNLDYFKLHPCSNPKTHAHKHCMFYHNAKDRKRYGACSENLCDWVVRGEKCPKGDECGESHSRVEQLYQYDTYKKKFCSHYPANVEKCEYGDYCSFAHHEEEIRIELIHNYVFDEDFYMFHYKTEFCPFNLTEHNKALCVYAHNWQDYRRSPSSYSYQPLPCYNWKLKDYIYNYEAGCELGLNCPMCHGWKELQYHPNYYRTNKCLENQCRKGECPNYHSEKEKRIVDEDVANSCFRYVAKNRMVEGAYKPESEDSFIPREELSFKSLIADHSAHKNGSGNFAVKTSINTKSRGYREKSPQDEESP